jgi:poly(3-hydroxybutyrate) depolymerase
MPMRRVMIFLLLVVAALLLTTGNARSQWVEGRYTLTPAERQELTAGRDHLRQSVEALKESGTRKTRRALDDKIPSVEIYLNAVDRALRLNEFFTPRYVELARACLKEGEVRVAAVADGRAPWEREVGLVAFGYRSEIDGSAQPYVLRIPEGVNLVGQTPGRLDVHLHGRMGQMNELGFLNFVGWDGASYRDEEQPFLVLHPFGRGNNGWHFAGEADVFEALADVKRAFRIDPDRIVLRGFSMGGHGAWHIGLHHPGNWAAMSPGAGFVQMRSFQRMAAPLPAWEEPLLHLYDLPEVSSNARNLPLLAYTGDMDPAIGQHQLMMATMGREGTPFREFIGPNTPHRYEPRTRAAILSALENVRREPDSPTVDFVTYTLRYPECKWVRLEALERHWERAEVHARVVNPNRVEATTKNVAALVLTPPARLVRVPARPRDTEATLTLVVDGQTVRGREVAPLNAINLVKKDGRWEIGWAKRPRKEPGLQGPIDDALFGPVVAVSGTGEPWSPGMERWTGQELRRFREGWDEFFRGTLPERTDRTVKDAELRSKSVYLFGDPGSNRVLKRLLSRLPIQWTRDSFTLAGRSFSTRDHLPMLVFPNPESPDHYVVINSGFTFSRADWRGSNALQYPHLPDYAAVRYDPDHFTDNRREDTEFAGFFDERWKTP